MSRMFFLSCEGLTVIIQVGGPAESVDGITARDIVIETAVLVSHIWPAVIPKGLILTTKSMVEVDELNVDECVCSSASVVVISTIFAGRDVCM